MQQQQIRNTWLCADFSKIYVNPVNKFVVNSIFLEPIYYQFYILENLEGRNKRLDKKNVLDKRKKKNPQN